MITFTDIIKQKIKYYIRNNKLESNSVEVNDNNIEFYNGQYCLHNDYFQFKHTDRTETLNYSIVDRIYVNNGKAIIETINDKSFLLQEDTASFFIEILKDILQSRDNIFHILKMDDSLSKNSSVKLIGNENINVSAQKEIQIEIALLIEAKKYNEARSLLSYMNSLVSQNVINYFSSYLQKSEAKYENKPILFYDSLVPALKAVNQEKNNSFQLQNLIDTYLEYQDNFFSIPQNRRKFVIITDEFYGIPKKGFLILLKEYTLADTSALSHSIDTSMITIPSGMSFPVGHPIVNNVYVVHPYNDKFYIPVEEHEEYLFNDRIDEFKTLVQALGATEIKFSKEHRLKVDQNQSKNTDVNFNLGIKAHGGNIDYHKINEQNNYNNNELTYETSQRSTPILKPYIPEKLVWFPKETTWQRMFKQRVGGNNLLGIEEIVSSKSHKTVSSNEIMDINIELKVFFINAGLHIKTEIKSSISEEEEMVQKISVTFATVDLLTEEYKEEVPINKENTIKIDYKNKNTELIPISLIENRCIKALPSILGKNIKIPISEQHNLYLDMIYVEGGTYWMGTDDPEALKLSPTSIRKQVSVDSFYISKYTITREHYIRVVKNLYANPANLPMWLTDKILDKNVDFETEFTNFFKVYLDNMKQKTNLNFYIPNDIQWEFAARGGIHSKNFKYAGSDTVLEVAWMADSDTTVLESVGLKKANELGIHDMSGNIYELVIDDLEDLDGLSLRGGGYWSLSKFCTVYHKVDTENIHEDSPFINLLRDVATGAERIGFRVILPTSEIEKLEMVENKEQLVKIKD